MCACTQDGGNGSQGHRLVRKQALRASSRGKGSAAGKASEVETRENVLEVSDRRRAIPALGTPSSWDLK